MAVCLRQVEPTVTRKSRKHQKRNRKIFLFLLRKVDENNPLPQVKQLSITFRVIFGNICMNLDDANSQSSSYKLLQLV